MHSEVCIKHETRENTTDRGSLITSFSRSRQQTRNFITEADCSKYILYLETPNRLKKYLQRLRLAFSRAKGNFVAPASVPA